MSLWGPPEGQRVPAGIPESVPLDTDTARRTQTAEAAYQLWLWTKVWRETFMVQANPIHTGPRRSRRTRLLTLNICRAA